MTVKSTVKFMGLSRLRLGRTLSAPAMWRKLGGKDETAEMHVLKDQNGYKNIDRYDAPLFVGVHGKNND